MESNKSEQKIMEELSKVRSGFSLATIKYNEVKNELDICKMSP